MDIISRLPGCAGQAADAVSAYTQAKMEDAPTLLKIPKAECPETWIRLPKHLFNISHFSYLCCAENSSLISCAKKMAKRMQEQNEEKRIVAKSRPSAMNLTSSVPASSSSVNSPIASKSPGILKASSRQIGYSGKPGCFTGRQYRETCGPSTRRISRKPTNSRNLRRLGTRRYNLATSFPHITRHEQGLLDCMTNLLSKPDR